MWQAPLSTKSDVTSLAQNPYVRKLYENLLFDLKLYF